MNLVTSAKAFATRIHVLENKQVYGHILPYTHHLQDVEQVAVEFGFNDEVMRAATWLHDIVEVTRDKDNEVRVRDIEELFGEEVAVLVGAVTSEKGENRKVRNALTYPKIRETGLRATALKLADRIANVRFGVLNGGGALGMYKKEYPEFRHGLYVAPPIAGSGTAAQYSVEIMWNRLDKYLK